MGAHYNCPCRFIVYIANTLAIYGAHFELSNSLEWIVFHQIVNFMWVLKGDIANASIV